MLDPDLPQPAGPGAARPGRAVSLVGAFILIAAVAAAIGLFILGGLVSRTYAEAYGFLFIGLFGPCGIGFVVLLVGVVMSAAQRRAGAPPAPATRPAVPGRPPGRAMALVGAVMLVAFVAGYIALLVVQARAVDVAHRDQIGGLGLWLLPLIGLGLPMLVIGVVRWQSAIGRRAASRPADGPASL
jgi:hypothetical protein